jgi:hypothetical protein
MGVDLVSGQSLYGSAGQCPIFVLFFFGPLSDNGMSHIFGPPGILSFSLLLAHVSLGISTFLPWDAC